MPLGIYIVGYIEGAVNVLGTCLLFIRRRRRAMRLLKTPLGFYALNNGHGRGVVYGSELGNVTFWKKKRANMVRTSREVGIKLGMQSLILLFDLTAGSCRS